MITKFKDYWNRISKSEKVKVFEMIRNFDESKHSGTGKVLDGVVFPNGKVAICWDTKDNDDSKLDVGSISIFDSFEDFQKVHIGQHPKNKTEINWLN